MNKFYWLQGPECTIDLCEGINCGNGLCIGGNCKCDDNYVNEDNVCVETCTLEPCQASDMHFSFHANLIWYFTKHIFEKVYNMFRDKWYPR